MTEVFPIDWTQWDALSYITSRVVLRYFAFATVAFVLFYVILKKPLWFRKIQQRVPQLSDFGREVAYSAVSMAIFGIMATLALYVLQDYNNVYRAPIEGWGAVWFYVSFLWMLILHDTYFYWVHRAMHWKPLYRHIHLVHHRSTNPSPWTAYAFHPIEAVGEAGIILVIAFTLPVHIVAVIFFFVFQIAYNVYGHLGFELYPPKFHRTLLGRWVNTSVSHNQHHSRFTGNYGLYFLFWDRVMGTLREDYNAAYEHATTRGHPAA
ncbi:MAG: sterol desaturase family protein [Pseudomonadota bacterium]